MTGRTNRRRAWAARGAGAAAVCAAMLGGGCAGGMAVGSGLEVEGGEGWGKALLGMGGAVAGLVALDALHEAGGDGPVDRMDWSRGGAW